MTANIGHGVGEIGDVMKQQSDKVAFTFRHQFTNEPAEQLTSKIADLAIDAYSFFDGFGESWSVEIQ